MLFHKNILRFALVALCGSATAFGQGYEYPNDKIPEINGESIVFINTPIYKPTIIPTSVRDFAQAPLMHSVSCLPPYSSDLFGYMRVKGVDKLDSVIIVHSNGGGEKIVNCYDSLGVIHHQMIKDNDGIYAEIQIKYNEDKKEVRREIEYKNKDKFVYELANDKPKSVYFYQGGGKLSERILWTYKNSMPAMASVSTPRDKEMVNFTYTPQKRLSEIKWKHGGKVTVTSFEHTDNESSVYNPIRLRYSKVLDARRQYTMPMAFCEETGEAFLRTKSTNEICIFRLYAGEKDKLITSNLTYTSQMMLKGGTKNMLSSVLIKDVAKEGVSESYVYYSDGKLKSVDKGYKQIQYTYNELGNIVAVVITEEEETTTIFFYYSNIEKERLRIAEEKAKEAAKAAGEYVAVPDEDAKTEETAKIDDGAEMEETAKPDGEGDKESDSEKE